jgi:glycosyltransferase involved in cell wall biosynthesis
MTFHPGRFSIALCTYNGSRYLPAQLDSYRAQTRLPDELVVCDDGSADDTEGIVSRFAQTAPFPVHFHRQARNLGSTLNFDDAIGRCSGEWIFLSDQDDWWMPNKLAAFAQATERHSEARLIASDAEIVDGDLRPKGYSLWSSLPFTSARQHQFLGTHGARLMSWQNMITGATAAFHAALVPLIRPIHPSAVHDAWIALLASAVAPCHLIDEPLIRYRQHANQQIGAEPLTLRRQYNMARRMNQQYFERQTAFFTAIHERLKSAKLPLRDAGLLDHLAEKIEFCRVRSAMRLRNRITRAAMAMGQALRGRYHRLDKGFKALAVDLFL